MAYLALYRKYRPMDFDHVVGQNFVTQILKNQILSDRVGHAYLLTGIRGTGKTSIAKIFARAINCTDNHDGNPCNQCSTCQEIEKPGVMDIIEIDAASNRGVDEIRDIRDKVKYPPKIGRYKVYIIDEVHMLTKEAFNALLKTLEEPPSHVVFILATTEPNKLPATILSRCQRYDIRPIAQELIVGQMQSILDDIDVPIETEALNFIAQRGDHSMRDSLSILDQVIDIRQGDGPITYTQVLDFLGMADGDTICHLVEAMLSGNATDALNMLTTLRQHGTDSTLLMGQLIEYLRKMAIAQTAGDAASGILGLGQQELTMIKVACEGVPTERIFSMINALITDRQKLKYNDLASTILEMSVLRQCIPSVVDAPSSPAFAPTAKSTSRPTAKTRTISRPVDTPASTTPIQSTVAPIDTMPEPPDDLPWDEVPPPEPPDNQEPPMTAVSAKPKQPTLKPEQLISQADTTPPTNSAPQKPGGKPNTDRIFTMMHRKISPAFRNLFTLGRLCDRGYGQLVLEFRSPEGENIASMIQRSSEMQKLETIAKEMAGPDTTLTIELIEKDYDEMSIVEKTKAIVNNVNIIVKETD